MQTLEQYIADNFKTKAGFAESIGKPPQRITEMINAGFVVHEHVVYSKRFDVKALEIVK